MRELKEEVLVHLLEHVAVLGTAFGAVCRKASCGQPTPRGGAIRRGKVKGKRKVGAPRSEARKRRPGTQVRKALGEGATSVVTPGM